MRMSFTSRGKTCDRGAPLDPARRRFAADHRAFPGVFRARHRRSARYGIWRRVLPIRATEAHAATAILTRPAKRTPKPRPRRGMMMRKSQTQPRLRRGMMLYTSLPLPERRSPRARFRGATQFPNQFSSKISNGRTVLKIL